MDEATKVHRAELVNQEAKLATAHRGMSFAATAEKCLFSTETAGSEAGTKASMTDVPEPHVQHYISKPTVLQSSCTSEKPAGLYNAEPPGKKVGPKLRRSQAVHARAADSPEWQTVAEWNSKRIQKKQAQEEARRPTAGVAVSANLAAQSVKSVERSDELKRVEERNSVLEKQNADLAAMMADNQRLLEELLITSAALTAAMAALTSTSQTAAQVDAAKATTDEPVSLPVDAKQPHTPVKQRRSKKLLLEEIAVRTPPKPPEGTPRRSKKEKFSA